MTRARVGERLAWVRGVVAGSREVVSVTRHGDINPFDLRRDLLLVFDTHDRELGVAHAIADFWQAEAERADDAEMDRHLGPELVSLTWELWEGETTPREPEAWDALPAIVRWYARRERG